MRQAQCADLMDARTADTARERIMFGASQQSRFGPRMIAIGAADAQLDAYEKAYYETRPSEYDQFVAVFGDVHHLR